MSGPTSVAGSSPDPSRSFRALDSSRWSSPSTTGRSTTTRLAAVQRWPVVPNADQRMPSVARSRSASAMTTMPFLPPSSRLSRFRRRPARSAMRRPVADEPVNEITGTSGESTIASPTSAPAPVTRLTSRREPGLGHQLDQERRAVGRVARRLENDGVAGDERRHHLPARDRDREVPGRDDPGHADRLADRHRPLVGQLATARCRRTSGGPRRPSGRRCRSPPGRRPGPRR